MVYLSPIFSFYGEKEEDTVHADRHLNTCSYLQPSYSENLCMSRKILYKT